MKRKITFLMAAFLLLCGLGWAQTREAETFTFSELGYANAEDVTTVEGELVTLTFDKGTGSNPPKYYTSGTAVRMYTNNTLKVALNTSTSSLTITAIGFTFSGNYTGSLQNWSGSSASVSFTNTASGQARIQVITVTVSDGSTPITYTVTYDCNGGTSGCPENVTGLEAGEEIMLADGPIKENYTFAGWSDGNELYDEGDAYTVSGNVTFAAQWTSNTPAGNEQWVLTSLADLSTDDVFVIVGNNGSDYAMTNNNGTGSAPAVSAVTVENDMITSTVSDNIQWNISGNATDGYTFYPNGSSTTWLYCTNTNNGVRVGTNDDKTFKLDATSGYLKHDGTSRYVGIYNSQDWRCYTSPTTNINNQTFAFYKKVTGDVLPPSITANNVEIEYNATAGTIQYTINNAVDGSSLTASTDSEWLTLGTVGETVPFTCTANEAATERIATVTLTYNYNNENISKSVTVTQAGNPNITNTISEITAAGNYIVEGTIVAKSTRGFIVGDGTGYVYYYNTNYNQSNYAIGDMVRLDGPVVIFGGVFEFNNTTEVTAAESSNYTADEPTVITGQDMDTHVASATPAQLSNYVQYEGTLSVSGTHYNITNIEGATTAIGSISYPIDTEFTSLQNKKVIVTGYFVGISSSQYYNTMIGSIEEVITTEPTINVTNNNIELAYDATSGEIAYTIDNPVTGTSLTATTDAEWISNIVVGASSITFDVTENDGNADRSATITLSYTGAQDVVVTVNQDHYAADYATLPFAFDDGVNAIAETAGLTQNGLGSDYNGSPRLKFNDTGDWVILKFNERPGKLTFDIKNNGFSGGTFTVQTSEDGITYTDLESYTTITGTQSEEFNNLSENVRFIKWIYTEKSNGNVGLGNIVLEPYTAPVEYVLNIGNPENITITAGYGTDGVLTNGENAEILSGTEITLALNFAEGYTFESISVTDENGDEINLTASTEAENVWSFYMPNSDVNVTATAMEAPVVTTTTYTLASSIESGKTYIIVGWADNVAYAMGEQRNNNRAGVAITVDGTTATVTSDAGAYEFVVSSLDTVGFYSIEDAINGGYLYAAASGSNQLKTENELDENGNGDWEISFNEEGVASVIASNSSNRNVMQFNNSSKIFACYATASQHPVYFYVKDETPATQSFTLDVAGYTTLDNPDGGYVLIASPIDNMNPAEVENMLSNTYDLYYYDENPADGLEWRNYKANAFNLESGKGYLYANSNDVTLTFTGTPYNGNGEVTLNKQSTGELAGWNLVGNPFANVATLDREFYVMNPEGTEFITADNNSVNAMQGIFVIAQEDGETITFVNTENGGEPTPSEGKIILNVNRNRGNVIDRAIVSFDENHILPKFMLNENNTKLFFNQNGEEYAVVSSELTAEMPVSFSAAENGTYTLNVNVKDTEMDYLHLIDNKTGEDIDLKANPSYSFEANTSDVENRFTLVFNSNTGVNENNDNFAFFNGSEWVINNTDNATVEVIDMLGRSVITRNNATNSISTKGLASGVYTIRLTKGNDVKTQKIVVE